jgi:hypothetical protein
MIYQVPADIKSACISNPCKFHKGKRIPYDINEGPGDREQLFRCTICGCVYAEYFK